ncbi:MAG: hypothetical protein AAF546_11535 [Verrucomicrobiota bacterium]
MNNFLLPCFVALLSFIFIGSAFFIIPKFELIFEDLMAEHPLPVITALILFVPNVAWLILAAPFAWWNYKSSRKENRDFLLNSSIIGMLLVTGTVVIRSFLPIGGTIMRHDNELPTQSPNIQETTGQNQP